MSDEAYGQESVGLHSALVRIKELEKENAELKNRNVLPLLARMDKLEAVAKAAKELREETYVSVPPYAQAHQIHWDKLDQALSALEELK